MTEGNIIQKKYDPEKLLNELLAANLPAESADSNGVVFCSRTLTSTEQNDLDRIKEAHSSEPSIAEKRRAAYLEAGITTAQLIVALWEKIIEGRDDASSLLQEKRLTIKKKFPKE